VPGLPVECRRVWRVGGPEDNLDRDWLFASIAGNPKNGHLSFAHRPSVTLKLMSSVGCNCAGAGIPRADFILKRRSEVGR